MKTNKLLFTVFLSFVLVLPLLNGCLSKKKETSSSELSNSDITIGFSIHGLEVERWKREKDMAEELAKKEGFNLLVMDAQKDTQKQIKQCENLIYQGVKALVLIPEDDASAQKIAKIAKENKVPLIAYDRLIRNAPVSYYITFDQKKVGYLQAKVITEKYPKGNYVHLKGAGTDFNTQ